MTKTLYLNNSYLKQTTASVVSIKDDKYIILDQTIFYAKSGGQPCDIGKITKNNEIYNVKCVSKASGEISHEVDHSGLKIGDKVQCSINWPRRYKLMRSYTAAHVIAALLHKSTGALITGNQLETDHIRFDFNLEKYDQTILETNIAKANELFTSDISVKSYALPREEAMKIPNVIIMAKAFPPDLPALRIVEIEGVDKEADGERKKEKRIYFKLN